MLKKNIIRNYESSIARKYLIDEYMDIIDTTEDLNYDTKITYTLLQAIDIYVQNINKIESNFFFSK